jgi:[ribosomal protein S5]-alanine N-acetyltransferase
MIALKKLNPNKDISKKYFNWMNSKEIQKYTEQRHKKHTMKDIKDFVKTKNLSTNEFLYGIFLKKKKLNKHIGNIKLGPIDRIHKTADISYFIGEKELWGKNYTTLAIREIIKIAKKKGVRKIHAGFHELNKGSRKVLKNNGFKIEGKLYSSIVYKSKRYSAYIMGLIL